MNVKLHNIGNADTTNDINQGAKIFSHFKNDPDFRFYYCVVNFEFTGKNNTTITFTKEQPTIFYIPWVKNVYVNPKNGHLQAHYAKKHFSPRNVESFLDLLEKQLEKIGDRLKPVLEESKKNKESTDSVAKRIAWERIYNPRSV